MKSNIRFLNNLSESQYLYKIKNVLVVHAEKLNLFTLKLIQKLLVSLHFMINYKEMASNVLN